MKELEQLVSQKVQEIVSHTERREQQFQVLRDAFPFLIKQGAELFFDTESKRAALQFEVGETDYSLVLVRPHNTKPFDLEAWKEGATVNDESQYTWRWSVRVANMDDVVNTLALRAEVSE